uniref:DEAD-box ATP-dependent RNA helicase 41 n=1 Tax=Kalanchoe fedtschenkoi TaxID=63787 RepID=A0A7N0URT2_KALFE
MKNGVLSDLQVVSDHGEISGSDADATVKARSWDQREAVLGEPKCIICGRYGEYICDETDDDICSLECKQTLLSRVAKSKLQVRPQPAIRLPVADECYYVNDSGNRSCSDSSSDEHTEKLRKKLDICVEGGFLPAPILSFSSLNLHLKLVQNIEAAGYEMPTPVQMQAIPAALSGKSLLVSAETGSGKTASYIIPVIKKCADCRGTPNQSLKKPLAMVLTPTRELCIQVEEQAKLLGKGLPFKTALVVGGDAMAKQLYRIQQGVELIVGTPGRLIDILTKHEIELDDVRILVLDEIDCMLEKGFRDQVLQLFTALSQPQVLMFSATIPEEVKKLASSVTKDVVRISIGMQNRPNQAVKQLVLWVDSKQKKQKLFDILKSDRHFKPPVIVFVSSRLGADLLSNAISTATGIKALSIHGEKTMSERRDIMKSFLVGEVPVLVATGILGRGLDLLSVRQVIVFDIPNSTKEYIHQIGRASRMGAEGAAYVFVNEENKSIFPELIKILKSSGAVIPRELANSPYASGSFPTSQGPRKRKYGR